jgi:tetratricopeptide (TPR) repeat protein
MKSDRSNQYHNRAVEALNDQISHCFDSKERLVLSAKRAILFARNGYIIEAKSSALNLRGNNSGYDARLSAWIMLLEGVIQHFEKLDNAKSKDKFVRAFLIGQVAKDRELCGLAAAWLAHCQLVAGDVPACIEHLSKAFEWSTDAEHEARGRAFMVLAGIYEWINDPAEAKRCLAIARNHASKSGDMALQSTIIFNVAAYAVARLTLNDCVATLAAEDIKLASLHVNSADNLNLALGIDTLHSLIPIMRAEIAISKMEWNTAIFLYDNNFSAYLDDNQERLVGKLYAQRAWCKSNINDHLGAKSDLELALSASKDIVDFDDLAVVHFRLSTTARLLGDQILADIEFDAAQSALRALHDQQSATRNILQTKELHLPKK